jgi:hypothetical protein
VAALVPALFVSSIVISLLLIAVMAVLGRPAPL